MSERRTFRSAKVDCAVQRSGNYKSQISDFTPLFSRWRRKTSPGKVRRLVLILLLIRVDSGILLLSRCLCVLKYVQEQIYIVIGQGKTHTAYCRLQTRCKMQTKVKNAADCKQGLNAVYRPFKYIACYFHYRVLTVTTKLFYCNTP